MPLSPPATPAPRHPVFSGRRLTHALRVLKARMRSSLAWRIVWLFLALLLVVQVLSLLAIRANLLRNARAAIAADLVQGEHLLVRLLAQNAQKLTLGAELLATDANAMTWLRSGDELKVATSLARHSTSMGATVAAFYGPQLDLRSAGQLGLDELQPVIARMADRARHARSAHEVVLLGQRPFQLVLVPLGKADGAGLLLLGSPIDQGLLDDLKGLSALQANLLMLPAGEVQWQAALSTLPPASVKALAARGGLGLGVASGEEPATLQLPEGEFSGRAVLLSRHEAGAVSALLMRSMDAALAPYLRLQLSLAGLTLLGLLLFAVGSVLTARHVTTPIRRLAAAAERLRAGDYSTPLRGQRRTDEIGELAQSFERMRVSIGEHQQEVLKLAYWDSLTGLPNRVQFRSAVQSAMEAAQPRGLAVAVVMLDLDRFKHVNDVLGYAYGDRLLKVVAERLQQQAVRSGDVVARLDGDEFAVLLGALEPGQAEALARAVAQRIFTALDGSLTLDEHAVDTSASLGLALWPVHAGDTDTLLNRAEVAMYTAKHRREGPMLYAASLDASSTASVSLLTELRRAVEHNELRLFLQPKLSLDDAQVVGAEALLRWQHPQRGMVPPLEFIPFAEQTGYVRALTQWVFEEAARTWAVLHQAGLQITLSVNLSTRDLLDPELPKKFDAILVHHQVPAEAFCLEITESAIMDDPQRAMATLERLSVLGFRLSIDDFGTGYSSLAYLKRLPVDEIKIDKSFVLNMEKDEDDARIVRSTIDLAHGLGLTVVAEGVENAQVWELLRSLHCNEAQGFHMSRPLPRDEFLRWAALWAASHPSAQPRGGSAGAAVVLH